jgi:hypothetical protein
MNVPAAIVGTPAPGDVPTIVRMGSIPHGVTVLMQGPAPATKPTPGKPVIPAPTPLSTAGNMYPGLSPLSFPEPLPLLPGTPNRPAVGIQPIKLDAAGPPPSSQHNVPEININADVLLPNQQPLPAPLQPPLPTTWPLSYQSTGPFPESFQ